MSEYKKYKESHLKAQKKYDEKHKEERKERDKKRYNSMKKCKNEIEILNNKINRAIDYIKEDGTTYLNLANQRKWCSEFSAENILKILGDDE